MGNNRSGTLKASEENPEELSKYNTNYSTLRVAQIIVNICPLFLVNRLGEVTFPS